MFTKFLANYQQRPQLHPVHTVCWERGAHPSSLLPWEMPLLPNICPYSASLSDGEGMAPPTASRPPRQHLLGQTAAVTVLSIGDYALPLRPTDQQGGSPPEPFPTEFWLFIHQRATFATGTGLQTLFVQNRAVYPPRGGWRPWL